MLDNFGQSLARRISVRPELELHPHAPNEKAELFTGLSGGAAELETLTLLNSLVYLFKPRFALETGTGSGYTAAAIASAMMANGLGEIHTVELDSTVRESARFNVESLDGHLLSKISFHGGESLAFIDSWDGPPFEFAFFDSLIAFRHIEFERLISRNLLAPGAVCVFHDTSRLRGEYFGDFNPEMIAALDRHSNGNEWLESGLARGLRIIKLPEGKISDIKREASDEKKPVARTFRHSGKLGDIIYSLPAVRAMGGGEIMLNADGRYEMGPTEASAILSLLRAQPYVTKADIWNGEPFDIDLDAFRDQNPGGNNLADCYLKAFGLRRGERDVAWLNATPMDEAVAEIVFARSETRHGPEGFWNECVRLYGNRAVFIGSDCEHRKFCKSFGEVRHLRTPDLLAVAQAVAASTLFVGNQSSPLAIAEGLKRPVIVEVDPEAPNCHFTRAGALCVSEEADIQRIEPFGSQWFAESSASFRSSGLCL